MIVKKLSDMKRGLYGLRGTAGAKAATDGKSGAKAAAGKDAVKKAAFVAVGNFDGMHRGHGALICAMLEAARAAGVPGVVFTFENYTKADTPRLISPEERNRMLADLGVDILILGDFELLRDLSPETFIDEVLIKKCRCGRVFCGYNFRFGRRAAADAETLRTLMQRRGGDAVILPPVTAGGAPVSSTGIRRFITAGDLAKANDLLREPFSVTGTVEKGKRLGRRLGMPTVNQYFPEDQVVPRFGVYASVVRLSGKTYPAVTNVGVRPTVDDGHRITSESYLFGFSGCAYGKKAKTSLLCFLRPERKFPSPEALRQQVEKDKKTALDYLTEKGITEEICREDRGGAPEGGKTQP